ncbi:MAG TPA: hypothetical protein VIG90_03095 [Pedomonas sp.]|uniref:hypothetical protein n=1 Tax=Pedomonas sp. TaxID=2976421 RepID=UPI002F3FF984
MKIVHLVTLVASMAALPALAETAANAPAAAAAEAQAAVQVKAGVLVIAADGRRIGRVDRVFSENGTPVTVSVIYSGRVVRIPVNTLSNSERGLVSTLTAKEIKAL